MSAVLVAVYSDHSTADAVRSRLVSDGFPTDRVDLTSETDLGQAKLVPRDTVADQLTEYFRRIFQVDSTDDQRSVRVVQRAVLEGKAVLVVQPRGEVETQRAIQLLGDGNPLDMKGTDLDNTTLEHAASAGKPSAITWVGKALAAAGARDTTGTAKLP
jgi:hypothetical protein